MNFDDVLADLKVKEFAKEGSKLSFERARLLVMIETPDFAVRAAMDSPDSLEKAIEVFNLSPRFVEISIARYSGGKEGVPTGIVATLEQMAEVRDMEKLEPRKEATPEAEEEQARLRQHENDDYIEILLDETDYSDERIAHIVGVPVRRVEYVKVVRGRLTGIQLAEALMKQKAALTAAMK